MKLPQLRRVRWAVRAVLLLGVAASVGANVLHARANPISEAIAAWPPIALLLTVELISRVPVHRRSLAVVRVGATVTIAGIAAWVSYWHMAGVAGRYGESQGSAHLLPFSVDGLVIVASISLVELAGRVRRAEEPAEPVAVAQAATPEPVAQAVEPKPVVEPEPVVEPRSVEPIRLPARPKLTIVDNLPAANEEGREKLTVAEKRARILGVIGRLGPDVSSAEIHRQTGIPEATIKYHRAALQEVSQ